MAILIRNAYVFAPKELGVTDVLMVGEKILAVGPNLSVNLPGLSVIDATGFILAPGFVDAHVHVLGGGGVNGPDSRAPAIGAGELIRAGITTVVGVLGADVMTRKLPDLLAKVRELNALGLSAWMYTSSFRYPPVTLTQSVADDVALVSEVLGVKLAMGDINGSFPSSQAVLEMLSQIRQAAVTVKNKVCCMSTWARFPTRSTSSKKSPPPDSRSVRIYGRLTAREPNFSSKAPVPTP